MHAQAHAHTHTVYYFFTFVPAGPIVVFGNNLDVYSVVQGVLGCGVSPEHVLVACPGKCSICPLPKPNNILKIGLHSSGVQLMEEVTLTHCHVKDGKLTSLTFSKERDDNPVTVTAQALLYMDQKAIDPEAFKGLSVTIRGRGNIMTFLLSLQL